MLLYARGKLCSNLPKNLTPRKISMLTIKSAFVIRMLEGYVNLSSICWAVAESNLQLTFCIIHSEKSEFLSITVIIPSLVYSRPRRAGHLTLWL